MIEKVGSSNGGEKAGDLTAGKHSVIMVKRAGKSHQLLQQSKRMFLGSKKSRVQKELKIDQDEAALLRTMSDSQKIRFYESMVKLRQVGCCGKIFVRLSTLNLPKQPTSLDKFGSAKRACWPHLVSPIIIAYLGFAGYMAIALFIFREQTQQFEFLRLLTISLAINLTFIRPLICFVKFGLAPAIGTRVAQTISVAMMTVTGLGGILSDGHFSPLLDIVPYVTRWYWVLGLALSG